MGTGCVVRHVQVTRLFIWEEARQTPGEHANP